MAAVVFEVRIEVGTEVDRDDELIVLESMKMEIPVVAPRAGQIAEIRVSAGDNVDEGDVLVVLG